MPEGPEIRRAADRIQEQIAGRVIDQALVAGLGNYLRSEILFFTQLPASARPIDLTSNQQQSLAQCIIETTRQAYHTAGVTNREAWIEQAKAVGEPRRQWRFAGFDRAGLGCHRCGSVIERKMVGSRRLYYCPHCQANG